MVAALQMDSLLLSHQGSPNGILKVKMLVTQSCPTLCNPIDCCPPGSSVSGILQARVLTSVYFQGRNRFLYAMVNSDAGRDWGQEEKGTAEDEMVGWHH